MKDKGRAANEKRGNVLEQRGSVETKGECRNEASEEQRRSGGPKGE